MILSVIISVLMLGGGTLFEMIVGGALFYVAVWIFTLPVHLASSKDHPQLVFIVIGFVLFAATGVGWFCMLVYVMMTGNEETPKNDIVG
jgi:hypothetical protein